LISLANFFDFPTHQSRFGNFWPPFVRQHIYRVGSKALLIGRTGIAGNFLKSGMSSHRRDLLFRAAGFSQTPRGSLAQSVRDASIWKTSGLYRIGHHVAETGNAKGFPENGG
jgi:hypothetical protein